MKRWMLTTVLGSTVLIGACHGVADESESTELDETQGEETVGDEAVDQAEEAVKIGDYYWPPRCGPRNCVAMCVTCEYDICRHFGGSIAQCKSELELCKSECYPGTCVPGDPGCPCTNPTDPSCI
ncbi:MAG: hypothetical protein HOW73_12720 [Polyangiaceae bacterium]|nr:hypothetical protein [Polyangiaceae bacterium]